MPGIFSKANRPTRPGAYFNFVSEPTSVVAPSAGSVVAVPIVHDWGPLEVNTLCTSFAEFQAIFGGADDTPGYRAVKMAFIGEGIPGAAGAGGVIVHRMGSSSAAKATKVLQNTAGTPANAITLSARYEGTRGNDLRVTTQDYGPDANFDELIVLDGAVELERYRYANTNITDLAAQINANSDWISASNVTSGTALGLVSSQALTGGNDGDTLADGDWTAALTKLETERFAVFAGYNLTDTDVLASLNTWQRNLNQKGKRFFTVVGGAAGETVSDANTRANSFSDPNVVNLGAATLTDESLGAGGVPIDLSTAELAPRVAGILAARGEYAPLTYARLAGTTLKAGPDEAGITSAFDGGTTTFGRDDDPVAPVRIEKGLTTWTASDANTDDSRPFLIYRQPKYVRTMHGIEMDLTGFAESQIIGRRPINEATRDAVIAEAKRALRERESQGVIQPGWTVGIDQNPPPTDEDEFIALVLSVKFGRALEQLFFSVTVA